MPVGFFGSLRPGDTIFFVNLLDLRRQAPRIAVDGLCGVVGNDNIQHATIVDLSTSGLRLERMFDARTATPEMHLEIELPGIDEVVWAHGVVAQAQLTRRPGFTEQGLPNFWFSTGVRILTMCQREARLLREYVVETLVAKRRVSDRRQFADRS